MPIPECPTPDPWTDTEPPTPEGCDSGDGSTAPCGGCGWFAGATEYDCFTLTVVGASGNMASVDTSQSLAFAWVADAGYPDGGYWESDDDFIVCEFEGPLRLWRNEDGEAQLTYLIDPEYTLSLSCCDVASQTLYFSGGNSGLTVLCCDYQLNSGPAFNLFTVALAWNICPPEPNPDYTTPGWYCVAVSSCAGTRECCYLDEDPGILIPICSGPHADEEDCVALCSTPTEVTVDCCPTPIPTVLFISFGGYLAGLGTLTATWTGTGWETTYTGTACVGITDVGAALACNGSDFEITVSGMLGGFPVIVWGGIAGPPTSCEPLLISFPHLSAHGLCVGTASAIVTE